MHTRHVGGMQAEPHRPVRLDFHGVLRDRRLDAPPPFFCLFFFFKRESARASARARHEGKKKSNDVHCSRRLCVHRFWGHVWNVRRVPAPGADRAKKKCEIRDERVCSAPRLVLRASLARTSAPPTARGGPGAPPVNGACSSLSILRPSAASSRWRPPAPRTPARSRLCPSRARPRCSRRTRSRLRPNPPSRPTPRAASRALT